VVPLQGIAGATVTLELEGHQLERLRDALVSAFPREALEEFALFDLELDLTRQFADGSLKRIVLELLQRAAANGTLHVLVERALRRAPHSPALRRFGFELLFSDTVALSPALEATILGEAVGVAPWHTRREATVRAVCSIELADGVRVAVGCLVAPRLVVATTAATTAARARFVDEAIAIISVKPDTEREIVLLELDAPRPGPVACARSDAAMESVVIVSTAGCRLGAVTATTPATLSYTAETHASGAPVFTMNWELVAVHTGTRGTAHRATRVYESTLLSPSILDRRTFRYRTATRKS